MLRVLFNEPKHKDDGRQLRVFEELDRFVEGLASGRYHGTYDDRKLGQFAIWSLGFKDGLDELEQSVYCSIQYAANVHSAYVEDMEEDEHDGYRRFFYFYKNGLIRVFSLLDKLGYFLDDWFGLQTGQVKPNFSFFTVLRHMHDIHSEPGLQQQLYELKTERKETLAGLRKQRNMEIHYVNAEMLDDWSQTTYRPGDKLAVENVRDQARELKHAYDMVTGSLLSVFGYVNERARERG